MPAKPPASENLADWLAAATGDLVPSAQQRVRAEIKTHYTEAVRAHLERGLTEVAAHVAALADLGDASAAAQRFQHEHLTKKEAAGLARFTDDSNWMLRFFFVFMFCFLLLGVAAFFLDFYVLRHRADAPPLWQAIAFWSTIVGACFVGFALLRVQSRRPFTGADARLAQRLLLSVRFMFSIIFVTGGLVAGFSSFLHVPLFQLVVLVLVLLDFIRWLIYGLPADLHRLHKLREATDDDFGLNMPRKNGGNA